MSAVHVSITCTPWACSAVRFLEHPGQLVVMDNLSVHHRARVQLRQCQVWFLPGYSPDARGFFTDCGYQVPMHP